MTDLAIYDLTCEYQTNPLGLGEPRPRLAWKLRSSRRGARQVAYRLRGAASENALTQGDALLWDTGRINSDESTHVPYADPPLHSGERKRTYPSWLFPVLNGATTIWKRWDGWTPEHGFQDPSMNSFNHVALGAIGDWLYRTVAGIETAPDHPGYKHILLRPQFPLQNQQRALMRL